MVASWTRESAFSLVKSEATWVLMVFGDTDSASAMALFDRPSATRDSTSRSRGLNGFSAQGVLGAGAGRARSLRDDRTLATARAYAAASSAALAACSSAIRTS